VRITDRWNKAPLPRSPALAARDARKRRAVVEIKGRAGSVGGAKLEDAQWERRTSGEPGKKP